MKCISIKQPWASLVILGAKKFETRSWKTEYRGPLLIHASKGLERTLQALCLQEPFKSALELGYNIEADHNGGLISDMPLGCVLGVVELVECLRVEDVPLQRMAGGNEEAFGDYSTGRYAWELRNPHRFDQPIPFPGHLGLWEFP